MIASLRPTKGMPKIRVLCARSGRVNGGAPPERRGRAWRTQRPPCESSSEVSRFPDAGGHPKCMVAGCLRRTTMPEAVVIQDQNGYHVTIVEDKIAGPPSGSGALTSRR